MRKTFSTLALAIISYCSYAQTNIFPASGKVGIGTVNPLTPLHIVKSSVAYTNIPMQEWDPTIVGYNLTLSNFNGIHGIDYRFTQLSNGASFPVLTFQGGNVGIGTVDPNCRLAVNGSIRAKEIKVEMSNWPDYVFTKDYKLPSLTETEKHIKEKGYLPGIPSATEVKANGVDLGEMNAKLLKKIEEITLYLIEQNQEIKTLNAKVEALQK